MKKNYTSEIEGRPETRVEADYNVTGGGFTTHIDLARNAAISSAMILAEEKADGWEAGGGENEWLADTKSGIKKHIISADIDGEEWGESWTGTVTVDGRKFNISVH